MNIEFFPNSALPEDRRERVLQLKDQRWPHGLASQRAWMEANLTPSDYHVLLWETSKGKPMLAAYLNLADIRVKADNAEFPAWGVGNVCTDKRREHQGYGRRVMDAAGTFIREHGGRGFLMCKKNTTFFYKKCGWKSVSSHKLNFLSVGRGTTSVK